MPQVELSSDKDGVWTVSLPGLIVTNLTQETAEAFAAAHRRLQPSVRKVHRSSRTVADQSVRRK